MIAAAILGSKPARRTLDWQRDPIRSRCRSLVLFFIIVCDINIEVPGENKTRTSQEGRHEGLPAKCWRKLTKSNRVSSLIRFIYMVNMGWLGLYTYYQTAYDIQLLRLERMQTATIAPSKVRALRESFDYYDRMLDTIGSPYKRANRLTASSVSLVIMMFVYIIYDQAALFLYFNRSQVDSYLMNMFRDTPNETLNCAQLIDHQAQAILKSQANYLALQSVERLALLGKSSSQLMHDLRAQLEQWASDGTLWPANHSAEWLTYMSRKFLIRFVTLFIFCIAISTTVVFIAPLALDLLVLETLQDWLALCAWQYVILLLVSSASFYISALFLMCRDRASYLGTTHNQMIGCMRAIKRSFYKLLAARRQLGEQRKDALASLESAMVEQMNLELLLAIMRYRILLAHIKSDQALFKFAAFNAFLAPVWPPLVVRLLSAYGYEAARLLGIMFCLTCIAVSILMLVPMCGHSHMGGRFYKTLSSLEAQTSEVAKQLSARARGRLDGHIIMLINRELVQPDLMLDKFAVKVFKYSITYPNIIKSHFWIILLLVSCLFNTQMLQTLLGNRSGDPLGIYDYLN